MPSVIKWPGGYQCRIRLAGYPQQSRVFDTKARALAWGYARESELKAQGTGQVQATLQDAINRYCLEVAPAHRGGANEIKRLKALSKTPGLLPVLRQCREVTSVDLSKFRDTRLEQVSVATVRKEMTIIRSVLESARRDWGMLVVNPISDVKRPPAPPDRDRMFDGDELERILLALNYHGKVITLRHQIAVALLLAFETAMRAGEMLALTWDRVHPRYVTLLETKNGDQRDVPLSLKARELLGLMRGQDKQFVFTVTDATRDAEFRKARDACDIKGLRFHDSRANAITTLAKKLSIHDLARMIGHRDINSLLIYYRESADDIAGKLG